MNRLEGIKAKFENLPTDGEALLRQLDRNSVTDTLWLIEKLEMAIEALEYYKRSLRYSGTSVGDYSEAGHGKHAIAALKKIRGEE